MYDFLAAFFSNPYVLSIIKGCVLVFVIALPSAALMPLMERKWSAYIQNRRGPGRASIGPFRLFGVFHVIADAIKSVYKEDFYPRGTNLLMFTLAPFLGFISAISLLALIPITSPIGGFSFALGNVNVGVLAILAFASFGVYGSILAGWSTDNKYGMLGAARASAQMISYEVFLGLALLSLFLLIGSFRIADLVAYQNTYWFGVIPKWGILAQPLGFLLVFTALMAEMKRPPFDAPEGESEIVAGYFIEYSGMRFASFFFAEYMAVICVSALVTTLYFGSYHIPFLMDQGFVVFDWSWELPSYLVAVLRFGSFVCKVLFFCWLILMLRWTLPRFRFDQIMRLGWNRLLPLALLNFVLTFLVLIFG